MNQSGINKLVEDNYLIICSSAEDNFGVGSLVFIDPKDILEWNTEDGVILHKFAGDEVLLEYYDFCFIPMGDKTFTEYFKQTNLDIKKYYYNWEK